MTELANSGLGSESSFMPLSSTYYGRTQANKVKEEADSSKLPAKVPDYEARHAWTKITENSSFNNTKAPNAKFRKRANEEVRREKTTPKIFKVATPSVLVLNDKGETQHVKVQNDYSLGASKL